MTVDTGGSQNPAAAASHGRLDGGVVAWRVGWSVVGVIVAFLCVWATVAIYYSNLPSAFLRAVVALTFPLGTLSAYVFLPRRGRTTLWFLVAWAVVFTWWCAIPARNDREWLPDVAVLARASIDGDTLRLRNIRDFEYVFDDQFTPRYYDRTFDLSDVDSCWLAVSYWDGNKSIAHTMLSFGFEGRDFVCVSVEARREVGEPYAPIPGSFKQFELTYVIGSERDVIGVRTNHRNEDVYLYPLLIDRAETRALLEDILRSADRLATEPRFYFTLGQNCTTTLIRHFNAALEHPVPLHRYLVLNGYTDEFAYEGDRIPTDRPFDEVRKAHRISDIARSIPLDEDFSTTIRRALPQR